MKPHSPLYSLALLVLTPLLLLPPSSEAQQRDWWTSSFFLDNDLFADEDDGYTNGIRLSFVSPDLNNFERDENLPGWLRSINRRLRLIRSKEKSIKRNMVVTVGQQIYTPDEQFQDREDLVEQSRPYAGWLYLGFGYQLRNEHTMETAIANIGVVGPAAYAQEAQDAVHNWRGLETFKGWDNQLQNELGLQVLYGQKHKVYRSSQQTGLATDLITHWGGSLGNVATYLETGLEWRAGWGLPEDFGTSSASPGGDNSSPSAIRDPRLQNKLFGGIHAFVAVNGRWVLHDITLDGNTFAESHSVDKEPLVGRLSLGVVTSLRRWQLGFSRIYISKEFERQVRSRGYGSVTVSYTYAF